MAEPELTLWPNAAYLQMLRNKHRKLHTQVEKYKRTFFAKYNDHSLLTVSEQLEDAYESIRLDFDAVVLEISQDINFLQLPFISVSVCSLFETMSAIQAALIKKNRSLSLMCEEHRKRGMLEHVKPKVCQYCMKHMELAKLKDLLPQTTFATHEFANHPQQSAEDIERDMKKLDLQKFYGSDQEVLMKKISALLSEKPASLSRKAADTEQTLQSILSDLFNKNNSDTAPLSEMAVSDDELDIDVADELTNTMKSQLLKHAGQPLKKYIDIVSEAKLKKFLEMRSQNMTSFAVQTIDFKSIEQIKALQSKLKTANTQLQGRKLRTQEVEKELMTEILELERCRRRMTDLEDKVTEQQKQNKSLQASRAAYQFELERIFIEKEQQIDKIKLQASEEERQLRREMHGISSELDSTKKELREKKMKMIDVDSMGVQTVFARNHQETQTQDNLNLKRSALVNGLENRSKLKEKKMVTIGDDKDTLYNQYSDQSLTEARPVEKDKSAKSIKVVKTQRSLKRQNSTPQRQSFLKNMLAKTAQNVRNESARLARVISSDLPEHLFERNQAPECRSESSDSDQNTHLIYAPKRKTRANSFRQKENSVELESLRNIEDNKPTTILVQPTIPATLTVAKQENIKEIGNVVPLEQPQSNDLPVSVSKKYIKQKTFIKKLSRVLSKHRAKPQGVRKKQQQVVDHPPHQQQQQYPLEEDSKHSESQQPLREENIENEIEDLKEVLLKEFDFLKKIGIIGMLQNLRSKKVERMHTDPSHYKRRNAYLTMRPMKVNYPQRADIPLRFCSIDLELFGGYQGAVKYTMKKGVYQNQLLVLDNYTQQVSRIMKAIDALDDVRKVVQLKSFLISPIETVVHETIKQSIRPETLKVSLKRIFKFHSYCKPRCDHIWSFFRKHGLEV